jgi:hypothetical protein
MNIKDYMMEVITTLVLIVSALFLFFNAYYQPLIEYQKDIDNLSTYYNQKAKEKSQELQKREEQSKMQSKTLNSVPSILKAINNTCKDSKIIIKKLDTFEDNPFKFELNIVATYTKFLKVLSEFEKLNIVIEDISMDEYDPRPDNPEKSITFIVQVIGDVNGIKDKVKKILDEAVSSAKRNPFTAAILDANNEVQRTIDLTYIYKLTSITPKKDNPFATINNKDYYIGDEFFNKGEIKQIENGKVQLVKRLENGIEQEYFIGYRRSKK